MKNLPDQDVFILIGMPGSGKSTWARNKLTAALGRETVIVSPDCIREMLHSKYLFDDKYENLVLDTAFTAIRSAIGYNFNVIIDEALIVLSVKHRLQLTEFVRFCGDVQIHYVFFTPDKSCVDRRMNDHRGVSKERWQAIYDHLYSQYEPLDEAVEDYDSIEWIDITKPAPQ